MWSYYGSKTKIAALYPKPIYDKIIEPFCGAAKYSLLYFEKEISLVDADLNIIKIWRWLQSCSQNDILSLPKFKGGDTIKDIKWDCEGQALFMGYMVGRGLSRPQYKISPFVASEKQYHFDFSYKRVAADLFKIKHWNIVYGTYQGIENEKATWFIDPPYKHGGQNYRMSSKLIDFGLLANYCKNRIGQVIVCENSKADWLDFKPLVDIQGSKFKTTESIYVSTNT